MDNNNSIKLMLGYLCIANVAAASLASKVEILDPFDLSDSEISTICGCSVQSVRNARQQLKKNSYGKK